jgi:hypothetical protein
MLMTPFHRCEELSSSLVFALFVALVPRVQLILDTKKGLATGVGHSYHGLQYSDRYRSNDGPCGGLKQVSVVGQPAISGEGSPVDSLSPL